LTSEDFAHVAIDLWRITCRAKADGSSERVLVACERAEDRLKKLGFAIEVPGEAYSTNMRLKVVDHEPSEGPLRVIDCLAPAIYMNGELLLEAEVVTGGAAS
jgi:hypothetical protein